MKKLKAFVERKRTDAKFKKAGEGRALGTAQANQEKQAAAALSARQQLANRQGQPAGVRRDRSGNSAAAAAALARFEKQAPKTVTPKVFSKPTEGGRDDSELQALKLQARAMAKARQKRDAEASAAMAQTETPNPIPAAASGGASASDESTRLGIGYLCPISATRFPNVASATQHMISCLKEQIEEEPVSNSALLIHSSGADSTTVDTCVSTIAKYINNIVENPNDPKFRRIRFGNGAFQKRVASVPGGLSFLEAVGFTEQEQDGEKYLVVDEETCAVLVSAYEEVLTALVGATALVPKLDRDVKLVSNDSRGGSDLPAAFYEPTKADVKMQAAVRSAEKEAELTLRTKAMRDQKKNDALKSYKFAIVRIRINATTTIQATFGANETVGDVAATFAMCLTNPSTIFTLQHPSGATLEDYSETLRDSGLAPASVVHVRSDEALTIKSDIVS